MKKILIVLTLLGFGVGLFGQKQDTLHFGRTASRGSSFPDELQTEYVLWVPSPGYVIISGNTFGEPDSFRATQNDMILGATPWIGDTSRLWAAVTPTFGYCEIIGAEVLVSGSSTIPTCQAFVTATPRAERGLFTWIFRVENPGWVSVMATANSGQSAWWLRPEFVAFPEIRGSCGGFWIDDQWVAGDTAVVEVKLDDCHSIFDTFVNPRGTSTLEVSPSVILRGQEVGWNIVSNSPTWQRWDRDQETWFPIAKSGSVVFWGSDTLTVTDGCDTLLQPIRIISVFLPNIFSPNDDGENDYWEPQLPTDIIVPTGQMTFQVFDRWGSLVFAGHQGESWDGTGRAGEPCPPGVYIATIMFNRDVFAQDVTLIR